MRRIALGLLLALPACDVVFPLDPVPAADGGLDTPVLDGPDAICTHTPLGEVCVPAGFSSRLQLQENFTTELGAMNCIEGATPASACIVAAAEVEIGLAVHATGSRPLVIFATGAIHVYAALSVASVGDSEPGAGASSNTKCLAVTGAPADAIEHGGGGGPGGSFQFIGGYGQPGFMQSAVTQPAPAIGSPLVASGGCRGGSGGMATMASPAGPGGSAGGAVVLVAGERIVVSASGSINASGAGGRGGAASSVGTGGGGGAGGGSGGLIALYAPAIELAGGVFARGGGGGSGGVGVTAGIAGGEPGNVEDVTTGGSPGVGGGAGAVGCGGGVGGGAGGKPALAPPVTGGGGGGGGGCGFILAHGDINDDSHVSPAIVRH